MIRLASVRELNNRDDGGGGGGDGGDCDGHMIIRRHKLLISATIGEQARQQASAVSVTRAGGGPSAPRAKLTPAS